MSSDKFIIFFTLKNFIRDENSKHQAHNIPLLWLFPFSDSQDPLEEHH